MNKLKLLIKVIFLVVFIVIFIGGSYISFKNYQCKDYLKGVPDSDFQIKEGIAILKSTGMSYTGKAYATVCGGECGFLSCSLLHWRATYKNGKLHGEFDAQYQE